MKKQNWFSLFAVLLILLACQIPGNHSALTATPGPVTEPSGSTIPSEAVIQEPTPATLPIQTTSDDLQINPVGITNRAAGENMAALHRSGQTFLTWQEREDLEGESYRIYRSSNSITAETLNQSRLLYEVWEGSANFYANRYDVENSGTWQPRYLERYIIEDNGSPLAENTGLLVWTLHEDDFAAGAGGEGYYAVTVRTVDGVESLPEGYTLGPLQEALADPIPVHTGIDIGSGGHLYIQYMDLTSWNPTFQAPNFSNRYYGLDSSDPLYSHAIQYAYDYAIYEPPLESCGGQNPETLPVTFNLHGHGDFAYGPLKENPDAWYCSYMIYPIDVSQTWYFGFSQQHDYRLEGLPQAGETIVNYSEQRLLRMVYDLIRQPPGPAADSRRIYVYGHSMGGSGTLALALHFPNVFAAAYASEPMTNYQTSGDGGGADWRADVAVKWGRVMDNLPVVFGGPANWAENLQPYDGTGVWDWQNHQQNLLSRQAVTTTPLGLGHGLNDQAIEWPTQGQPIYEVLNNSRQAWGGIVTADEHTWLSFQGLPPGLAPDSSLAPFYGFRVLRTESVPGLSNSSADPTLPPQSPGLYNSSVLWSSSWNPWDGAPLDTADRWQISLCAVDSPDGACGGGTPLTVDVTPRRLQAFQVQPGEAYRWENMRINDETVIDSGLVTASQEGLLTIPAFAVSAQGNRLRIRPADSAAAPQATQESPSSAGSVFSWPDTSSGIHVFNDQLAGNMTDEQVQFAASHYAGTQKMTRAEIDRLRANNPNFILLNYRLGLGLGYQAVDGDCQPNGEWLKVIEGNEWVQEYPGDSQVAESWFYHQPEGSNSRVLNCDWGWYLAELDDPAWRSFWQEEVLSQVLTISADGVFMDSLSVPNFLGASHYSPALPDIDEAFEAQWTRRINDWLAWLKANEFKDISLIPNAGSWITSRDAVNYSLADGVMVEGFAIEADASPYALEDWQLQMNRVLGLVREDKIVIAQTYALGDQERLFAIGSYLLVKGRNTYINLEMDLPPEWWPEYDLPVGTPVDPAAGSIGELYDPASNTYQRRYDNALVVVNPSNPWDGTRATVTLNLDHEYYLAVPQGGGEVSEDGTVEVSISYKAVNQVVLPPFSAAVLFVEEPTPTPP